MVQRYRSVSHKFFIRAPPKKVFEAVSDPKQLVKWASDTATVSPRKGGSYTLGFDGGRWIHSGKVLQYLPGVKVAYSWEWPGGELHGTKLTWTVKPMKGGTLLKVEHSGFPRSEKWTDLYGITEWGWTYYSMNLKSVMETGHDLRSSNDG